MPKTDLKERIFDLIVKNENVQEGLDTGNWNLIKREIDEMLAND